MVSLSNHERPFDRLRANGFIVKNGGHDYDSQLEKFGKDHRTAGGQWVILEQPQRVSAAIREFLAEA